MERKYTISQVANGFVVTPDYKENLNRQDLNVFNKFNDMVTFLEKRFALDSDETLTDKMADDITREDHERIRKSKENRTWEDYRILDLNLSSRAHNALQAHGLRTVRDINERTDFELYKFRNVGRRTVVEIREKIDNYRIQMEEQ